MSGEQMNVFQIDALESRVLFTAGPLDVPALSSRPSATAHLYLDFDGHVAHVADGQSRPATAAYDLDGDSTNFSAAELDAIREIWARVAEKYSPFDLNVTTVSPASFADNVGLRVVIGGNGAWAGSTGSGFAGVGSWYSPWSDNIAYVFSQTVGGTPRYTADVAAHEAGHAFGLYHQSTYDAGGSLVAEYNPGDADRAPLMGIPFSAARGLWWLGTTQGPGVVQDELQWLGGESWRIGFGYRADDHGAATSTATALTVSGAAWTGAGVIPQTSDRDYFSFTTTGGSVSIAAAVAQYGAMLDLKLELRDGSGNLVASADTSSLGESINTTLAAGTYYLVVASHGSYGDVGQYTLSATLPSQPAPPPVANAGGPYAVQEGGTVQLSAAGSSGSGLVYEWDLDGDGIFGETGAGATRGNETGATPTFSASGLDDGARTVSVRVTAGDGQSSIGTATINIANTAPTLAASGSALAVAGVKYFLGFSATDVGPDTVSSWLINWGDGNSEPFDGAVASASHTYAAGDYTITITATDEDGTYSIKRTLTVAAPDTQAPVATVGALSSVASAGNGTYTFNVAYNDNIAVLRSALDGQDVLVTGPNGFSQLATLVSVNAAHDQAALTATYRITVAGGLWTRAMNGTYTIALRGGQVSDTAGNAAAAATLGTFSVLLPAHDSAGNTRTRARNMGTLGHGAVKIGTDFVASYDTQDYYRLRLASRSVLQVKMTELTANANLQVRNLDHTHVKSSGRAGTRYEYINITLNAGVYYLRIMSVDMKETPYRLRVGVLAPVTTTSTAPLSAALTSKSMFSTDRSILNWLSGNLQTTAG